MNSPSRYRRQENLESFGSNNQSKLLNSRVLIVGLGGLGIPVAQYLNAMGIGTLGLVENDRIELHNLQRQVLYTETDVGRAKLTVALEKLRIQNSNTELKPYPTFLTVENAIDIISDFDVVVDATDNFATRYLLNDACVIAKKPFIYGALHAFEGQVSVFNYKGGPTYRCLFPDAPKINEIPNCDVNGVLGVLPGIIGSLQALEVVKVITGIGEALSGKLLLYDGMSQTTQKIRFEANAKNQEIDRLQDDYGFSGCETVAEITAEAFMALETPVQLIDVRTQKEYMENHMDNAIHIPIDELVQEISGIDFKYPVYFLCQSGKRSEAAVKLVQERNPDAILISISGGMNEIASLCH